MKKEYHFDGLNQYNSIIIQDTNYIFPHRKKRHFIYKQKRMRSPIHIDNSYYNADPTVKKEN